MSEKRNTTATAEEIKNAVAIMEKQGMIMPKNITDSVMNTLTLYEGQGSVNLPQNYSVGNAMKSAWLKFQAEPKLMACEPASIANALLDMAISGLNPSKNQCYFIPMGNKCVLMASYFGKQCAVKRIRGVIDIRADVIYKGTGYELTLDEWGNDDITITKPCPLEERTNANIIAAWAKIILDESVWGVKSFTAIMTLEDIKNAFNMGAAKGNSPAHKNFLNEMAKKTAINRCIKNFLNSRDDEDILVEVINRTAENDYIQHDAKSVAYAEINSKQAQQVIDVEELSESVVLPHLASEKEQVNTNTPSAKKTADNAPKQAEMEW